MIGLWRCSRKRILMASTTCSSPAQRGNLCDMDGTSSPDFVFVSSHLQQAAAASEARRLDSERDWNGSRHHRDWFGHCSAKEKEAAAMAPWKREQKFRQALSQTILSGKACQRLDLARRLGMRGGIWYARGKEVPQGSWMESCRLADMFTATSLAWALARLPLVPWHQTEPCQRPQIAKHHGPKSHFKFRIKFCCFLKGCWMVSSLKGCWMEALRNTIDIVHIYI